MKPQDYLELVQKYNKEALYPTDMVEAIIGIGTRDNGKVCLLLDTEKCVEILSKDMSEDDAREYFEFNTLGSYMGDSTPIFVENVGINA